MVQAMQKAAPLVLILVSLLVAISLHAADTPPAKDKKPGATINEADPAKSGSLPPATATLADRAARAFARHDWVSARKAYREMLTTDPENALAWANLGAVEQQSGAHDAAASCFEASVRFNDKLAQSWISLGLIYSAKGDHYRALSCLARALHEDPTDAHAHNFLAIEVKNLGWTDAAVTELQRAIEISPDYGLAHFNLAAMYLDQKPPAIALAKRHYDRAMTLGVEKDDVLEQKLKAP